MKTSPPYEYVAAGMKTSPPYEYCLAFFAELLRGGVRHAVCSPGSRSGLLVLAAQRCGLSVLMHHDERSGGFLALGLAKQQRGCVALVSTSGSAAANYLPAVTEAFYDGVGLLVLTADRPPEIRDRGAGQTIDQVRLYGGHVRWFADLPVAGEVSPDHARYAAGRALAEAAGTQSGPVHVNFPFRKPLEPSAGALSPTTQFPTKKTGRPTLLEPSAGALSPTTATRPQAGGNCGTTPGRQAEICPPTPAETGDLLECARNCERGLIAVGPGNFTPAEAADVLGLGRLAGWPVLADAASNLRFSPPPRSPAAEGDVLISTGTLLAGAGEFWRRQAPEVVLRIGHPTASLALREGLAGFPAARQMLVDPSRRWEEAETVPDRRFECDPAALCSAVSRRLAGGGGRKATTEGGRRTAGADGRWLAGWQAAERAAWTAVREVLEADDDAPLLEAGIAKTLGEALPAGATVYVSNSMPVRDLDAFLAPRPALRVLAQRGVNGIDGVISAAFGVAAAEDAPVVVYLGDLALLHDLGGLLWGVNAGFDLTMVVANNNGGGIFDFLPIAKALDAETFDALFHTPHNLDLRPLVEGLGARHRSAGTAGALAQALAESIARPGVDVIEVPVDSAANVAEHQEISRAVSEALATSGLP